MPTSKPAPTRKASGRNIPNSQRRTVQVLLRLPPDVGDELRELAAEWQVKVSYAVARLLSERRRK